MIRALLFGLFFASVSSALADQVPRTQVLVLTHVTIIDGTGSAARPDCAIIIRGDRIDTITKSRAVRLPQNTRVIDARGKYLIPGLWDMHVHIPDPEVFFPLFLANGVTGVRDTFSPLEPLKTWRDRVEQAAAMGPHVVMSGPMIDGPKPQMEGTFSVRDEASAREAVRSLKAQGADFVKVYNLVPRDAFFAIANECKRQNLRLAGHVPFAVTASEASDAGQSTIEHLTGVLLSCSAREEQIAAQIRDAISNPAAPPKIIPTMLFGAPPQELLDFYDNGRAQTLFERFAKNGTRQVPTLVVLHAIAYADDPSLPRDERIKYLPTFIQNDWLNPKGGLLRNAEQLTRSKAFFRKNLELVGAMKRAGVKILAGTDCPNRFVLPGFSLHDELALLVEAGLTPMQALQSATHDAAEYLGKLSSLGTIERGKAADLVLLDANPLNDIHNTRKIAAVIRGGHLLERPELDSMLHRVAESTNIHE